MQEGGGESQGRGAQEGQGRLVLLKLMPRCKVLGMTDDNVSGSRLNLCKNICRVRHSDCKNQPQPCNLTTDLLYAPL